MTKLQVYNVDEKVLSLILYYLTNQTMHYNKYLLMIGISPGVCYKVCVRGVPQGLTLCLLHFDYFWIFSSSFSGGIENEEENIKK